MGFEAKCKKFCRRSAAGVELQNEKHTKPQKKQKTFWGQRAKSFALTDTNRVLQKVLPTTSTFLQLGPTQKEKKTLIGLLQIKVPISTS